MAIKGAVLESGRLAPHLLVRGAAQAMEFYQRALGAEELYRSPLPHSGGLHIQCRIGQAMLMLTDEGPEHCGEGQHPLASPQTLKGSSVTLDIRVDDVDAAFQRAVDAGATATMPPMEMFWGDRFGMLIDPFGHVWSLTTVKEELTPEEVERRMAELMKQIQQPQPSGE